MPVVVVVATVHDDRRGMVAPVAPGSAGLRRGIRIHDTVMAVMTSARLDLARLGGVAMMAVVMSLCRRGGRRGFVVVVVHRR